MAVWTRWLETSCLLCWLSAIAVHTTTGYCMPLHCSNMPSRSRLNPGCDLTFQHWCREFCPLLSLWGQACCCPVPGPSFCAYCSNRGYPSTCYSSSPSPPWVMRVHWRVPSGASSLRSARRPGMLRPTEWARQKLRWVIPALFDHPTESARQKLRWVVAALLDHSPCRTGSVTPRAWL